MTGPPIEFAVPMQYFPFFRKNKRENKKRVCKKVDPEKVKQRKQCVPKRHLAEKSKGRLAQIGVQQMKRFSNRYLEKSHYSILTFPKPLNLRIKIRVSFAVPCKRKYEKLKYKNNNYENLKNTIKGNYLYLELKIKIKFNNELQILKFQIKKKSNVSYCDEFSSGEQIGIYDMIKFSKP
ncbi:hypothetical protein BpHYR1_030374 [Brachionus plicatilis]|uniref:Uncharacterized protein n=1 Tax=Brachionus plicatilis TaxID=10195 RepID=A0A3M7SYQ4_BRAPC|nr:hypothetical protein BpHYR1_030374 [Brachionus plicatilis]